MARRSYLEGSQCRPGLVAALFLTGFAQGQQEPSLRGQVVDGNHRPVSGANIITYREGAGRAVMPNILSNSQGMFELFGLKPGRYRVLAVKNEDGFGDPDFSFFAMHGEPAGATVSVLDGLTASVTINLGDPLGRLSVLIVDADTNEPLEKTRFRLSIRDDPNAFVSSNPDGNARFIWPVPPVPIVCEISMPGYSTWRSENITVKKGDIERLTVHLKRINPKSQ